jgi:hypothetical protein
MQRIFGLANELLASQRLSLMTKTERERVSDEIKKTEGGSVIGATLITKGWGESEKFAALKVTRQHPLVLQVKVGW